jgi:hypothetical protein
MDDEEGTRLPPLSKEQLARALLSRKHPCPFCGGTTWDAPESNVVVLPVESAPDWLVQIERADDDGYRITGVTALPLICRECGFIAQFAYSALRESLAEDGEHE